MKAAVFSICLCFGILCSFLSWNSMVYIYVGDSRTPAAVPQHLDLSNLQGTSLTLASRDRLFSHARLIKENEVTGIELGNFLVKSDTGEKNFACHTYQRIQLKYQAVGEAVSGEIPEMSIEGPCLMSDNVNTLKPLWIPQSRLIATHPHDYAIDYEEHGVQMNFQFKNMGNSWPEQWVLLGARLYDPDQQGSELAINAQGVRLPLNWSANRK